MLHRRSPSNPPNTVHGFLAGLLNPLCATCQKKIFILPFQRFSRPVQSNLSIASLMGLLQIVPSGKSKKRQCFSKLQKALSWVSLYAHCRCNSKSNLITIITCHINFHGYLLHLHLVVFQWNATVSFYHIKNSFRNEKYPAYKD